MKDALGRDALAALSLANLSLLGIWNGLLNTSPDEIFFLRDSPSIAQYSAALVNVALIGICFFAAIRLARHAHRRFGLVLSLPILILISLPPARAIVRLMATRIPRLGNAGAVELLLAVICITTLIAQKRTYAAFAALLITISPLMGIEAALSIVRCLNAQPALDSDGAPATRLAAAARPRVVWMIFDDFDYRLAFPDRPANLALPNFDRLRSESISASHATTPGTDTLHSVNSMLTGRNLTSIAIIDARHATADGISLASLPTIFSVVHGMGRNAAVDGWHLPYCRMFSADLAACSWHDIENSVDIADGTFAETLVLQQRSLFEFGYASILPTALMSRHRARMIQEMTEESRRYASDPSLDFVFLHLPAPHPPHFYDRFSGTFSRRAAGPAAYPDSLALADRMLGDIRESMTGAGLWDRTTILVSSDHPNLASSLVDGKTDSRVPFLLKLAGQNWSVPYDPPLRTIVTKALLEAILSGQIASPEQAAGWLQTH